MLVRACVSLLLVLHPGLVFAGEIFGTIRESGKPVRGAAVNISCPGNRYSGMTDSFGSYRVFIRDKGVKCRLAVNHQGQTAAYDVFSYADPVRYEFEWQQAGGTFRLIRR